MGVVVVPTTVKVDKSHFRECLLETLTEMFGQECVNPLIKGDKMTMTVEGKMVNIDLSVLVSDLLLVGILQSHLLLGAGVHTTLSTTNRFLALLAIVLSTVDRFKKRKYLLTCL